MLAGWPITPNEGGPVRKVRPMHKRAFVTSNQVYHPGFTLFNNAALVKVGIADTNRIDVERLP